MTASWARGIFPYFDVWEDCREFLCDLVDSGAAPWHETQQLLEEGLIAGAEDWHSLIDCAKSNCQPQSLSLDGQDVLTSLFEVVSARHDRTCKPSKRPWEETDRLIDLAKGLETDARALLSSASSRNTHHASPKPSSNRSKKPRHSADAMSHYWGPAIGADVKLEQRPSRHDAIASFNVAIRGGPDNDGTRTISSRPSKSRPHTSLRRATEECTFDEIASSLLGANTTALCPSRLTISPFFSGRETPSASKRPLAGTVSCVPFPPLTGTRFGIIQEELAHEPFWLLIAVTFPAPQHLVDPVNESALADMIRHLGLVVVRVAYIQKYARAFLKSPPKAGMRYRVRNYGVRDVTPTDGAAEDCDNASSTDLSPARHRLDDAEAWEIGHMTQGKYALDSWRIFCRDQLLGRAHDYNGKGREPEFQPEWMRVMPKDKELRAFLRWMWMREGWEWDPRTGDRTVLREEMQRAVNEGRVEYDDEGGLRILDKSREA